ncbi:c2h2 conidiation transcription factor [Moniliophthora roreri]|nr:c2h2 conidiation transcription factor [Moniliophthora roreri]
MPSFVYKDLSEEAIPYKPLEMSSGSRKHHNRRDVPLPPISQIFDGRSQEASSLSLPPLRTDQESTNRASQAYGRMSPSISALQHPVAPTSSDSRHTRHDHRRVMGPPSNPLFTPSPYSTDPMVPSPGFTTYQQSGYTSSNHYPPAHHQTSQRMIPSASRVPGVNTANPAGHYYPHPTAGQEFSMSVTSGHHHTQHSESSRPRPGGSEGRGAGANHYQSQSRRTSTSEEEDSGAPKAKYECSYCGKGFLRPSALKIMFALRKAVGVDLE